jgi:hypothetical protein
MLCTHVQHELGIMKGKLAAEVEARARTEQHVRELEGQLSKIDAGQGVAEIILKLKQERDSEVALRAQLEDKVAALRKQLAELEVKHEVHCVFLNGSIDLVVVTGCQGSSTTLDVG